VDGTSPEPGNAVKVDVTVWAHSSFSNDHLDIYYTANANAPSWTFVTTLTPTQAGAQILSTSYILPSGDMQAVRANFRWGGEASPCTPGPYNDHDDLVFAVDM
jgi:hypothetical protein